MNAGYGQVGRDVGIVGRWVRLLLGASVVLLVVADVAGGSHSHAARTNVAIVLFFLGFIVAYFAVYALVVDRLEGRSPWIPTVIFVLPAIWLSMVNPFLVRPRWSLGHAIGMPWVDHPLFLAMLLYIGVSLPVQFFTRYGGCEVVAIQNLIFRRSCASYCVPLLPLDMAEKAAVDALARRRAS